MTWYTPLPLSPRRLGALAIGLVAVLTLVAATAAPAAAAPPEVLASENPVVVPANQSTKNITLSWNLGNAVPKATLTVKDNSQTVVLTQTLVTPTGSTPLTVTYGKTYTAQLATVANPPQPLGSPLTITTMHPVNDPNATCVADLCVTSVVFDPHGTYAPFTVKTSKPAHFTMEASTDAPNANGTFAHVDSAMFNLSNVTQWNSHLLNLEANTTYHYVLKATDTGGQVVKKSGTFKTLRRRAEVTFTSIHMIEDSDILSACDCTFTFQAGNLEPSNSPFVYLNSGETFNLSVMFKIDNPSNNILVRVHARDEDNDWSPFPCYWTDALLWHNGSGNCWDYSFAAKWVDAELSGMEDLKFDTYTLTADDGPVKFTATVKVKVFYVP
jgi:hypothetical protein